MILIGFAGGLRRSELAGIRCEHLQPHTLGITIMLPMSMTDQEGQGREVEIARDSQPEHTPLSECTCQVLRRIFSQGSSAGPHDRVRRFVDVADSEAAARKTVAAQKPPPSFWLSCLRPYVNEKHEMLPKLNSVATIRGQASLFFIPQAGYRIVDEENSRSMVSLVYATGMSERN